LAPGPQNVLIRACTQQVSGVEYYYNLNVYTFVQSCIISLNRILVYLRVTRYSNRIPKFFFFWFTFVPNALFDIARVDLITTACVSRLVDGRSTLKRQPLLCLYTDYCTHYPIWYYLHDESMYIGTHCNNIEPNWNLNTNIYLHSVA